MPFNYYLWCTRKWRCVYVNKEIVMCL